MGGKKNLNSKETVKKTNSHRLFKNKIGEETFP